MAKVIKLVCVGNTFGNGEIDAYQGGVDKKNQAL